jgi:succinyl-CoA synthetase alpha subunit
VGLVSRRGTLTYQISKELALLGIRQSTVVGIGGDPVVSSSFIDILARFEADPESWTTSPAFRRRWASR